ncbi:MAG: hypothetical protein P4L74_06310 [Candidatus Doudnabacteria bacterium]|nr:hypothetical protein [Candidatus Doudnabacteria bacterium]
MDKNLKNSLLFGAATGGLFALFRNAGNKQKLSDLQLKAVNDLRDAFAQLVGSLNGNIALAPILTSVKEFEVQKRYQQIVIFLEKNIQKDAENLGLVKSFKSRLQYVLSGRFTEEKNNAKAHQTQAFFVPFRELPALLETLLEKHTQIFRLMQKGFGYMETEGLKDFKPEDSTLLKSYVSQFQALDKQATSLLSDFK